MQSLNNIHKLEPTDMSSKKPIEFNHYKSNKSMEVFFSPMKLLDSISTELLKLMKTEEKP